MTSFVSIKRASGATLQFKCPMSTGRTFSFADIVEGRDASVRVTDDNMLVAVDLGMVVSGEQRSAVWDTKIPLGQIDLMGFPH